MNANEFPILLLDNFFLFPRCDNYLPLENNNTYWKKLLLQSWKDYQGHLLVIPNKEKLTDSAEKFAPVGTLARINLDISATAELEPIINSYKEIQLRGLERIKIISLEKREEIWYGKYQTLLEKELDEKSLDELTEKFVRHLPDILEKSKLSSVEKLPYMTMIRGNISNLVDFITQNSREIDHSTKWKILASLDLQERLEILINLPDKQKIEKELEDETKEEIKKQQEDYYLREKQKVLERKLRKRGIYGDNEIRKYLEKLEKGKYPDYVKKVVQEEIDRHEHSHPNEASMIRTYLDWLVNLPWWQKTEEINDLEAVRRKLNEKYYGLPESKEKIIEYLVDSQKSREPLSKVLCLIGPPGVGKTFFASCAAEAMGRKSAIISLGGMNDVAEILGHRRTYLGAMPGRIVQTMKRLQVNNPLLIFDEVDKISQDNFRGNLSYALLAVLDPNQNKKFIDNYLGEEVPLDLSQVMFICTANSTDLPSPLLDRMEIIFLSSYTEVEKLRIAKQHLIPKNWKKYNLTSKEIDFEDQAILSLIRRYTQEAGVRELDRKIQNIFQKFNVQAAEKKITNLLVTPEVLSQKQYLGKEIYDFTRKEDNATPGVVNGLAWTASGGDILPIEVNLVSGEGKLGKLTGSLGKVMKESVDVAFSYVQSYLEANKENFKKELSLLEGRDVNIHAPEGAVEKEGPSAGITLTTAILSALTNQRVPSDIGMTGEITSKGKILKIGGLKEKAIAAHRSGLKTVIIPKANEKDIEDVPEEVRQELKIITVEEYEEAWKLIFTKKRKKNILLVKKRPAAKPGINP